MTGRQAILARLKDIDPWWIPVGMTAGLGTYGYVRNRPQEGGRSAPEQKSLENLQAAGSSNQEQLEALQKHKANVAAEERAGAVLAGVGGSVAGWGGKELLKRINKAKDTGHTTSPEQAEALYRSILPKDDAHVNRDAGMWGTVRKDDGSATFYFGDADRGQAQHIPPGGYAGKFGRDKEVQGLLRRGIPEGIVAHGLEHGATLLPGEANPHVAAHELGHAAFSRKPYAKAFRRAAVPLALASSLGADTLAARSDPDSTTSKLAPAMAALGLIPMLGEEAYASIKGIQGMRKAGLPKEVIRHGAAQGARAWGAYAMKYGLPVVASPYIIRKVREYRMNQREKAGLETTRDLDPQIEALQQK